MRRLLVFWAVAALVGFNACGPDPSSDRAGTPGTVAAATVPTVKAPAGGFKLSIVPMAARDPLSWERNVEAYQKARRLGCSVAHSYVSWGDVELEAGKWDWQSPAYYPTLAKNHGMLVSMELTIINVMTLGKLPKDLEGHGLKDKALQDRWLAFLEKFGERFKSDIQYLWLGNEIDTYFSKHPEELDTWTNLLERSVQVLHRAAPQIKVGTVITYQDALSKGHTDWVHKWGPLCDVVAVTYYPQMMPGGYKPDEIQKQFDDLVEAYGQYRLALVETGVSACEEYGGGEAVQTAFCAELFQALRRHQDRFEFGGWFNLHDFSPDYVELLTAGWGVESRPFSCWIGGTALASFGGEPRPVYAQWAQEAQKLHEEQ